MNVNKLKLSIKLSSLAAEARIIRKKEKSILKKAQLYNKKFMFNSSKPPMNIFAFYKIESHRKTEVSLEARATNIAMGFLNNKEYSDVENSTFRKRIWTCPPTDFCHDKPYDGKDLWKKVVKIAYKYSYMPKRKQIYEKAVSNGWIEPGLNRMLTEEDFMLIISSWRKKHPDFSIPHYTG